MAHALEQNLPNPVPVPILDPGPVLATARALQDAAQAGGTPPALRGKKLGLWCEDGDASDAARFRRAAEALGAHVAHIRPSLTEQSTMRELQHTARVLGRLYDALECQGTASVLVHCIGREAGVPVYDGIACATHPLAALAVQLDPGTAPDERHGVVVQAVLLSTLT
jgi:ornithine carbamoyltransferase